MTDKDPAAANVLAVFLTVLMFLGIMIVAKATNYSAPDTPPSQDYVENTCGGPAATC